MTRLEFFSKIEDKYNIGLKTDRCIVLRFDARNTTKNKKINLLDESEGSFSYALKKTSKNFTSKYPYLYIYVAVDEINIIVLDSKKFLKRFKSNNAQEITCTISQELSFEFHKYFNGRILFAGRSFSVYKDNLNSYLIYRKHTNVPTLSIYFIKRFSTINRIGVKFPDLDKYAIDNIKGYKERTTYQKEGLIYYKGMEFELEEILKYRTIENLTMNTLEIDDM